MSGAARMHRKQQLALQSVLALFLLLLSVPLDAASGAPALVGGSGAGVGGHQSADDGVSALLQWLEGRGGKAHVQACRNAHGVRGLCSTVDAKPGDWLVELPAAGLLTCTDVQSCTRAMLRELDQRDSSLLRPWLDTLPDPSAVLSSCNMPAHLLPFLASDILQEEVRRMQEQLRGMQGQAAGPSTVAPHSMLELQRACALASTRTLLDASRGVSVLMPVLDLLNHRQACPHAIEAVHTRSRKLVQPGQRAPPVEHLAYVLVAGTDVRAGEELCISYAEGARDDYFLMSWGFLPSRHAHQHHGNHTPQQLMAVDDPWTHRLRARTKPKPNAPPYPRPASPNTNQTTTSSTQGVPRLPSQLPTRPFQGSAAQLTAELARLQSIEWELEGTLEELGVGGYGAGMAFTSSPSSSPVDWREQLLRDFQQRRSAALRHEIARLRHELQRHTDGAQAAWGSLASLGAAGLATMLGLGVVAALAVAMEGLVGGLVGWVLVC